MHGAAMTRQAKKSASVAEPTRGQLLALDQLKEIEAYADGELEIIEIGKPKEEGVSIAVELSVRTKAFRATGGLKFRDRESFFLHIPANFPLKEPSIGFGHRRFLGAPHVQWGYHICLYLSVEAEWVPSDGMYGVMQRLHDWLVAAGKGELDPDDAPLHPPAAYVGSDKHFVFRANAPAVADGSSYWLGLADLRISKSWRFDVVAWRPLGNREEEPPVDQLATALLLSDPFPFEYPTNVWDLVKTPEAKGVSLGVILTLLEYIGLTTPEGEAGYMILGAPMRRPEPGGPTLQHLTAWEIESDAIEKLRAFALKNGDPDELRDTLAKWMVGSVVRWCYFHEDRPEVTKRRDNGALASFAREKRILLLGCGALGSNVAECLVRAGAKSLHLVDNGIVSPGLLVRQNFKDGHVGLAKARGLESLLNELELGCDISADVADISKRGLHSLAPEGVDLVIDATASRRVAHRLEQDLKEKSIDAPMLCVSVDGSAEFGSVLVRMPEYVGGPVRLSREAKINALRSNSGHAAVKAFWPQSRPQLFLPEPGCSDPTFTGSYADVSALAASMLNLGLRRPQELANTKGSIDLFAAPCSAHAKSTLSFTVESRSVLSDERRNYDVLLSDKALTGIDAEISRIARVRESTVETGGLIFGEIDEIHQQVFVDTVTGPPPDSEASAEKFLCGTSGTAEMNRRQDEETQGSSKFIGIWHTHPVSPGQPSDDDYQAMVQLLHLERSPPRHVLMMIVEFSATEPNPRCHVFRRGDFLVHSLEEFLRRLGQADG